MAIVRTVLQDCHSGESGWEGSLVTFEVPDAMADAFRAGHSVTFAGWFADALWNDNILPLLDDAQACDLVFECWISTEPRKDELAELPWKDLQFRDDIRVDPEAWTVHDAHGNSAPLYKVDV